MSMEKQNNCPSCGYARSQSDYWQHSCIRVLQRCVNHCTADLTTTESAVADLMELNDKLTAERDRLRDDFKEMIEGVKYGGWNEYDCQSTAQCALKALNHKEG